MQFDIGNHLFTLGLTFLFLKFLLPLIIGLILLAGAYLFFRLVAPQIQIDRNWLIVIVCVVLILLVITAAG